MKFLTVNAYRAEPAAKPRFECLSSCVITAEDERQLEADANRKKATLPAPASELPS